MTNRLDSVDQFRVFALLGVIAIHTRPLYFEGKSYMSQWHDFAIAIDIFARFAVPFFFIIAGYFWGRKIRTGAPILATSTKTIKRLLLVFVIWSLLYLMPYNIGAFENFGILGPLKYAFWQALKLQTDPLNNVFQGTRIHLWYLLALAIAVAISGLMLHFNKFRYLFFISFGFYVLGVIGKAYVDSPIGWQVSFDTRNGPFFSMLMYMLGIALSKFEIQDNWSFIGSTLFGIGLLGHTAEIYILVNAFETTWQQDYVFSTPLMGLGVAMIALSNKYVLPLPWLTAMGKFSLGIYAIHFMLVDIIRVVFRGVTIPVLDVLFVFAVFILSWLIVSQLARVQFFRKFVQ